MRKTLSDELAWAIDQLQFEGFGHVRRHRRLAHMLARMAERPAGRVSQVFDDPAERQAAYDLLEEGRVSARSVCRAFARATARTAREEQLAWVYAVIDGSSLSVTDLTHEKGLGSIGNLKHGARGLKTATALALAPNGVPIGLLGQKTWARTQALKHSANKRSRNAKRPLEEKETRHFVDVIQQASEFATHESLRLRYVIDREADNQDLLLALEGTGHEWIVRSAWDRLTESTGDDRQRIRQRLEAHAHVGSYGVEVSPGPKRKARTANMVVRTARVALLMRRRGESLKQAIRLAVNVVWTREEGTTPQGETPLDWLLLTNVSIETFEDACELVYGYTQRWRIEELHKTWKSGLCRVEDSQLRSGAALSVWALLLLNVAVRAERLRLISRAMPDRPASDELSHHEIRALILLKRQRRARNEVIPDAMPTLSQAILWVAQLGGYTGKPTRPPGAITIARGLAKLGPAAEMHQLLTVRAVAESG